MGTSEATKLLTVYRVIGEHVRVETAGDEVGVSKSTVRSWMDQFAEDKETRKAWLLDAIQDMKMNMYCVCRDDEETRAARVGRMNEMINAIRLAASRS